MNKNKKLALWLLGLVVIMTGLSFAAVPLYSVFCRATGYNGTTERAQGPAEKTLDREIEVKFDAVVSPQLPWRFHAAQRSVKVKIGETSLVHYAAENLGATATTGTATYNVQPDKIGKYFTKIQCFCFTEQTLQPGETADLPVTFYIDPKIVNDPNLNEVTSVTLSYTFFPAQSKEWDKAVDTFTQPDSGDKKPPL